MSKNYQVRVKKLEFTTTGDGFVKPIARLTKEYKYGKKAAFDALVLESILLVEENRICKTSKLDIEVTDEGQIKINKFYAPINDVHYKIPMKCTSCGEDLRSLGPDLVCTTATCKATELGGVFVLLEMCNSTDYAILRKYLLNFPTIEDNMRVHNLIQYVHAFIDSGPKDSWTRRKMFERGEFFTEKEIDYLIALEIRVATQLKSMDDCDIWAVLNIPHFTVAQLADVNPRRLVKSKISKFNKTQQAVIAGGKRYFKTIATFMDELRGK